MEKKFADKLIQAREAILKASNSGNYILTSPTIANVLRGFRRGYRKEKIKKLFPDEQG